MSEKKETLDERSLRLGLEYAALSEVFCDWSGRDKPYGASEGEVETSKAISLKRIADVLERGIYVSNSY